MLKPDKTLKDKFNPTLHILLSLFFFQNVAYASLESTKTSKNLLSKIKAGERIKVIINLKVPEKTPLIHSTKKNSNKARITSIRKVQDKVLKNLRSKKENPQEVTKYRFTPQLALSTSKSGLELLTHDSNIASISEDTLLQGNLGESTPKIFPSYQAPSAYSGKDWAIAILDTGVDKSHPAFAGRVTNEACFSSNSIANSRFGNYYSLCPGNTYAEGNGFPVSEGDGAGADCREQLGVLRTHLNIPDTDENITGTNCSHGTGVAGIAVGGNFSGIQGVASQADIIAIQIVTAVHNDNGTENDSSDDTLSSAAFTSDILKGLQHVLELNQDGQKIAAVNLSYSGFDNPRRLENTPFRRDVVTSKEQCENALDPNRRPEEAYSVLRPIIQELKQAGIATVISSGNNDVTNGVGAMSCIEEAISVGASDDNDERWDRCFNSHESQPSIHRNPPYHLNRDNNFVLRNCGSNSGELLDLWAPGVDIVTAKAGGGTEENSGTSEAAPHVAGAWAVMKQSNPTATVDEIENAFKSTGKDITVDGVTRKRINIDEALVFMTGSVCQASLELVSNQWAMISLPCMPPSNKNTVQDIFGDDGMGGYDRDWVIYSYENEHDPSSYKKNELTDMLEQGKGYWIMTTNGNVTLDMPDGSLQTPSLVAADSEACMSSNKGCFEIPVATTSSTVEWNLLGNPYLFPDIQLSELRIITDDATSPNNCGDANGCTMDEAEVDGIFHNKLWSWTYSGNPATGEFLTLSFTDTLKPWMGAWAATLNNSVGTNPRLLIPNKAP